MGLPKISIAVLLAAGLSACATGPEGEHLVRARFSCDDGRRLEVTFNTTRELAVLHLGKGKEKDVELPSQHPASGMWYKGPGYELRGAGDTLDFTAEGQPPVRCVQLS